MIVANIEGLAGFTKRNKRSCEIFYARREKTLGLRFWLKPWPQEKKKEVLSCAPVLDKT